MNKVSILIADSEETFRQQIRAYLREHEGFYVAEISRNARETVRLIDSLEPDLVFMEVELPGRDGFSLLQETQHLPDVVYTTWHDSHAVRAFESNAVDFLLKPLTKDRFAMTMGRYTRLRTGRYHESSKQTTDDQRCSNYPKYILVESGKRLKSIPVAEIIYLKADRDYTWIYTEDGSAYLSSYGIGRIEKRLDPQLFMRLHRSYIVNTGCIRELYKDITKTFVSLSNDVEINIGRNYYHQVKQLIF